MVGAVDRHSNKSVLSPPTAAELANFARQARSIHPRADQVNAEETPVRSLRRRFSPQQIEDSVARYSAGEDISALSRAYGVSLHAIRGLLLAEGVSFL